MLDAYRASTARARTQVGGDFQRAGRPDVGQADSGAGNFQHFVCARALPLGRAASRDGNGSGAAHVRDARCLHARRGAAVRRQLSLLSRAELRRHRHDLHEGAEFRRARSLLPFALRRDDGAVALVVSKELLPLLHGRARPRSISNKDSISFSSRVRAIIRFNSIRSGASRTSSFGSRRSILTAARLTRPSPFCSTRRTAGT